MSLALIVPTKGRPGNAARLIHAVNDTASSQFEELILAVDYDEPLTAQYLAAVPADTETESFSWVRVCPVTAAPQRMAAVLNALAVPYAQRADYVAFMGDDHLPRTRAWDTELVNALGGRSGVAYGNDLVQGEALPTACVISSEIIRVLGFMCPPSLEHLYLDDFWKLLGGAVGNLAYCPDVIIEHLHPTVGKAVYDEYYLDNNSVDQYQHDRAAYDQFLAAEWDLCLGRLKDAGISGG